MDKRTLVEDDFKDGERLLLALDEANFPVHSALWLFDEDRDSWRLLIATETYDHSGQIKAYEGIYEVLKQLMKEEENFTISLDNISAISPGQDLIKSMGTEFNTGAEIAGIRFTRRAINKHYIEDAYIYRVQ